VIDPQRIWGRQGALRDGWGHQNLRRPRLGSTCRHLQEGLRRTVLARFQIERGPARAGRMHARGRHSAGCRGVVAQGARAARVVSREASGSRLSRCRCSAAGRHPRQCARPRARVGASPSPTTLDRARARSVSARRGKDPLFERAAREFGEGPARALTLCARAAMSKVLPPRVPGGPRASENHSLTAGHVESTLRPRGHVERAPTL